MKIRSCISSLGNYGIILLFALAYGSELASAKSRNPSREKGNSKFPDELVNFIAYSNNPVFTGTETHTWDQKIRERGYILKEDGVYHLWYTGYNKESGKATESHPGYATSEDGINWKRYLETPIFDSGWVEDMCVIKSKGIYYMFAEGKDDIAHLLTSVDRINWEEKGALDIRYSNGQPLSKGPFGTPAIWLENGKWYLFYERDDRGIWLAVSTDLKVWTNIQDEPVIQMGPDSYDQFAVAVDQIIKYKGRYYAYYHASGFKDWHEWSTCVAKSEDLIHWVKYSKNPILNENKSSPVMVKDGKGYRLYTMHSRICLHLPAKSREKK